MNLDVVDRGLFLTVRKTADQNLIAWLQVQLTDPPPRGRIRIRFRGRQFSIRDPRIDQPIPYIYLKSGCALVQIEVLDIKLILSRTTIEAQFRRTRHQTARALDRFSFGSSLPRSHVESHITLQVQLFRLDPIS